MTAVRIACEELTALANLIERPPLDDVKLDQDVALRSARAIRTVVAAASAQPGVEGWIVGNGDATRWRCWGAFGSEWTDDRDKATRYARREDAEAVHEGDEDAWRIEPYLAASQPLSTRQAEAVREAAAKVADAHARSRAALEKDARNKSEKRDHESMGMEARFIASDIRAMLLPTIESEDREEVERLQAAWDSYRETTGELALPPIIFTEAEAKHIIGRISSPNAITDDGARGWQPIETAPLDVELWLTDGVRQWQGHGFQWDKMARPLFTGLGGRAPTHWVALMPLPAAPHANVEKEAGNGR